MNIHACPFSLPFSLSIEKVNKGVDASARREKWGGQQGRKKEDRFLNLNVSSHPRGLIRPRGDLNLYLRDLRIVPSSKNGALKTNRHTPISYLPAFFVKLSSPLVPSVSLDIAGAFWGCLPLSNFIAEYPLWVYLVCKKGFPHEPQIGRCYSTKDKDKR